MKKIFIRIKNISENKKRLASNFFSLSALQFVNYLLPFITIPYLIRVVGIERFGVLAIATSLVSYFLIFTDYGFNLSAVRYVSINRDNPEKLNEIFSAVMIIKTFLMFISIIIFSIIVFSFSNFRQHFIAYYLSFGLVLGNVLAPNWFFQGIEKMKYIANINISSKIFFTIPIFLLIKKPDDYYLMPLFISLGVIFGGAISLIYLNKKFQLKLKILKKELILSYIKDSWSIFITVISANIYMNSAPIVLGIFASDLIAGYYSIAYKTVDVIQNAFLTPLGHALYPFLINRSDKNRQLALVSFEKLKKILMPLFFISSILVYLFSPLIIRFLAGSFDQNIITIMRVLAILIFISGNYHIYGGYFLFGFGYIKEWANFVRLTLIFSILAILICFILFNNKGLGMAFSTILIYSFALIQTYYYYRVKKKEIAELIR